MRDMLIDMNDGQLRTLAELQAGLLDGTVAADLGLAASSALRLHCPHPAAR